MTTGNYVIRRSARVHMKEVGMGSQQVLFNQKKEVLNRISISTIFCLIILLPVVMKVLQIGIASEPISLLEKFDRLLRLKFWWPALYVDEYKDANHVHGSEGQLYSKDLCTVAESFREKSEYFVQNVLMHMNYFIALISIVYWKIISTQFLFMNMHFLCQIMHLNLITNHWNHRYLEILDITVLFLQCAMSLEEIALGGYMRQGCWPLQTKNTLQIMRGWDFEPCFMYIFVRRECWHYIELKALEPSFEPDCGDLWKKSTRKPFADRFRHGSSTRAQVTRKRCWIWTSCNR